MTKMFGSGYKLASGICLGAAVATKWSGAFVWVFGLILAVAWAKQPSSNARRSLPIASSLVVVPMLVYLASYGAFWWQHGPTIGAFLTLQARMLSHQLHHSTSQPENSAAWTWPFLLHPIAYYSARSGDRSSEVLAVGNPAFWLGFLVAIPLGVLRAVRRRMDWRDAVSWGGYLASFLPWLAIGRTEFIYYALPAVPFMCLACVAELRALGSAGRSAAIVWACLVTLSAIAFAPLWIAWPVPHGWVSALRLLPSWPRS